MGVYAITGGSGGIGLRVISQLENRDMRLSISTGKQEISRPTFLFQKDGRK